MLESSRTLTSINDMFGLNDDTDNNQSSGSGIMEVDIFSLVPKHNHRFRTTLGDKKDKLTIQSIKEYGVLQPLVVRSLSNGKYEIIAGHRRTLLAEKAGLTKVPVIIKDGLTEDEYDIIESETNLTGRDWADMLHSERARVIASHYNATAKKGIRKDFIEEIKNELQTLTNPVNTMADEGLSPVATKGNLRDAADGCELSKDTVARYLRVNTLIDELKDILDEEEFSIRAAVQISYITEDHQEYLASVLEDGTYKLDIKKAELIRQLETKGQLTEQSIMEVLTGSKAAKKPGKPKPFKMQSTIISKYFKPEQKQKEIEDIIDKALEQYFENKE